MSWFMIMVSSRRVYMLERGVLAECSSSSSSVIAGGLRSTDLR